MKLQTLLTGALLLTSPLLLAQTDRAGSSARDRAGQTTQQTLPQGLPTPGAPGGDTGLDAPSTDDQGNTSTGARSERGAVSATANPQAGTGALKARGGQADFASFDMNSDGKLSRDELKSNNSLSGRFDQLDRNRDGALSRGEYRSGLNASARNPAAGAAGTDDDEGSNRTDRDDSLDRRLNPGG